MSCDGLCGRGDREVVSSQGQVDRRHDEEVVVNGYLEVGGGS